MLAGAPAACEDCRAVGYFRTEVNPVHAASSCGEGDAPAGTCPAAPSSALQRRGPAARRGGRRALVQLGGGPPLLNKKYGENACCIMTSSGFTNVKPCVSRSAAHCEQDPPTAHDASPCIGADAIALRIRGDGWPIPAPLIGPDNVVRMPLPPSVTASRPPARRSATRIATPGTP
jgi:hypothetical protein